MTVDCFLFKSPYKHLDYLSHQMLCAYTWCMHRTYYMMSSSQFALGYNEYANCTFSANSYPLNYNRSTWFASYRPSWYGWICCWIWQFFCFSSMVFIQRCSVCEIVRGTLIKHQRQDELLASLVTYVLLAVVFCSICLESVSRCKLHTQKQKHYWWAREHRKLLKAPFALIYCPP